MDINYENYKFFSNFNDIDKFISDTFSNEIKLFQIIKVITYENYLTEYKKMHFNIAYFYDRFCSGSFEDNMKKINLLIEEESKKFELSNMNSKSLLEGLSKFDIKSNENVKKEKIEEIIREYTKNTFNKDLNRWLKNPKDGYYKAVAYLASILMYSLNTFEYKYNMFCEKNEKYLYKGSFLSYISLLEYIRAKGKIILFTFFISTVENKQIIKRLLNYKSNLTFSVIFIIKNNYKKKWIPNAINIRSLSEYNEIEYIFLPFSFFYVNDVHINYKNKTAEIYLETIGKTKILEYEIQMGNEIEYNKEKKIIEVKKN